MGVTTVQLDVRDVEYAVGRTTFDRGSDYARQGRVQRFGWDGAESALYGTVLGRGDVYRTSVYFDRFRDYFQFAHGECSCPVGLNCKHVAALVVAATQPEQPRRKPSKVTWDRSLEALLDGGQEVDAGVPLAIELTLAQANARTGPGYSLTARMVRPGKNGGWVGSGLNWNQLGYYGRDHRPSHLRLLREFYAMYQSGSTGYGYYAEKTLNLLSFESEKLWPLLDEARELGLGLVHARKGLGDVARPAVARLHLDVTGSGTKHVVDPVLTVDEFEQEIEPLCFIGSAGHGLVYVDREQVQADDDCRCWQFRLARLAKPAPAQLQRLVLDKKRLEIPKNGRTRFRDEFYPRLRHLAPVTSSDGAFTPPEISGPTLVLRAAHEAGHALGVDWEWEYQVGDSSFRAPLGELDPDDGYRDPAAERAVLASVEQHVPSPGPKRLAGTDTMRFVTEVLPLLADLPGVEVENSGEQLAYREVSDTVEIGVSTGEVPGETDWFDLGITISADGRTVPFLDVFLSLNRGETHLLLPDGAYFSLEKPQLRSLAALIEEARALQETSSGDSLRISRFQAGLWEELAELGVVQSQAEAWQRQVEGLLSADALRDTEVPTMLDAQLRPYQTDGFGWLSFLWEAQLGGILADDMGLGKTVQTLALICRARETTPDGAPFLIVAPTSVVSNWATESARFAPELNVRAISETTKKLGLTLDEVVEGADVVVTSYALFRLDFDACSALPWSGLVLDEAQFAKNHQSKVHQCARLLPAPFKLAITGTPMENNLMELWSLLSITAPGLFPSPTRFREYYALPIEKHGDTDRLAQLRRRIKPLIKRRTKEQVAADLPAKQEQVLEVELHPKHRKLYQTQLQRERQKVLGLVDDLNKNRFTILQSLTLLRQLSLHAGLVDEKHDALPCSKIDALIEQLTDVIDGGHRALVFSQFTGFLDRVRTALDAAGVEYCYLDGKTRGRAAVLKRFKEGTAPVFLISLKAGGFGLNLTEADYCFLLDPWWNPATEAQAVDRTHRIGQSRNVMVYRLVAKDTIEEKVMALKARKAELFANVIDEGNVFGASLDADDIRGLFT
ncbi:DEAD/DEAH box helicase [Lentzea aerocolonigenes]|uniref:DEAD/DEAH box helicase n=1 Tax=Lentzea aerocolonigenes TaxID=68170 RepID=UPI0004C3EBD5|nr:SNF2-related protein [Lentzea aerocolonigenes]MCP2247957.1 SNF2 helicase associated [Lentzea aerocolonigenes]